MCILFYFNEKNSGSYCTPKKYINKIKMNEINIFILFFIYYMNHPLMIMKNIPLF